MLLEQAAAVWQLERPIKVARQLRLSCIVLKKDLDSGEGVKGVKGVLPSANQEFIRGTGDTTMKEYIFTSAFAANLEDFSIHKRAIGYT